jgi:hypothetical protein
VKTGKIRAEPGSLTEAETPPIEQARTKQAQLTTDHKNIGQTPTTNANAQQFDKNINRLTLELPLARLQGPTNCSPQPEHSRPRAPAARTPAAVPPL